MTTKCVVKIGYTSYVTDTSKAITLLEILNDLELYEEEYHSSKDGNPSYTSFHVYPQEEMGLATVKLLPTNMYQVAKIAGKPTK